MKIIVSLLSALCVLSACALVPKDSAPEPATSTVEQIEPSASNALVTIESQWWRSAHDAQLDQLMTLALANSPSLDVAAARLMAARSLSQAEQSKLIPQLSGGAQILEEKLSQNYYFAQGMDQYNGYGLLDLSLSWSLDIWGKQKKYFAASSQRAKAAAINVAAARHLLTSSIAKVYVDLDRATRLESLMDKEVRLKTSLYQIAADQQRQGLIDILIVNQKKTELDIARTNLSQAALSTSLYKHQLAALVKQGPSWGDKLVAPQADWASLELPDTIPANLLARRPDLQVLLEQIEASKLDLQGANLEYLPDINLQGLIGYQAFGLPLLLTSNSFTYNVGPAISLPIFDGGRIRANISGKEAARNEMIANYENQLTQALREAADGIRSIQTAQRDKLHARQALDASNRNVEIGRTRRQAGLLAVDKFYELELSQAQQDRQIIEVNARSDAAKIILIQALGGSFLQEQAPAANPQ
jgi:NodT family efflux transporter outer membrane factor (OMF) lipoprotein